MNRRHGRPRGYLALLVRSELQRVRLARAEAALAVERESGRRYQDWYRAGVHIIAALQADLAHTTEHLDLTAARLARLEADAERDAPVVSGWAVDLEQALADNRELRAKVAALEARLAARDTAADPATAPARGGAGRLEPSPAAVRAQVFARLTQAAPSPADLPQPVVPLWDKDARRNAS
ncbi:hypothetical protein [Kitasatospora sp. NPDC090091]|uniref:hypothetical protein n=1 Tax=Kitasatospora sp. NPDC090091 TaxID=3364081 RepID=UPI0037FE66AF